VSRVTAERPGGFPRCHCDSARTRTDAVGLAQMRSRRIQECWSTDFHLRLGGARLLIDV
jgi:hypothetical protein